MGVVAGLVISPASGAQEMAPTTETLHVYTNLIQVPVLVLSEYGREPVRNVALERFSVSLDSGLPVRPTHVRLEGDDPISLSILLDMSGAEAEVVPVIAKALADLSPRYLTPRDRVSIYVLDCSLLRLSNDRPAGHDWLLERTTVALDAWTQREGLKKSSRKRGVPECKQSVPLWDALTYITQELYRLPGRRVMLALTTAQDEGSRNTWNEVRQFTQATSVAVFGMRVLPMEVRYGRKRPTRVFEEPFNSICELSGGFLRMTDRESVGNYLKQFMEMLRGRYIVEFPRSSSATPGQHGILVRIAGSRAYVRATGVAVPVANAQERADPTTLPKDPTLIPQEGTRRILGPP